jgi:secondary thiamine-phosphate synthase enzyme
MKSFSVRTNEHTQFVNITREVQAAVSELAIKNGIATIFIPHTTAGVTINENADPDVTVDIQTALERAVPWQEKYNHSEGNAAAHAKASMVGSSVQVIVKDGRIQLGTWQAIYFCEFDGPRLRSIWVQ